MKNQLTAWFAGFAVVVTVSGCGGGGGSSSSGTKSTKPTSATRARVLNLFGGSVRSLSQAGFQTAHVASTENAVGAVPTAASNGATGATSASTATGGSGTGIPLIGAFLRSTDAPASSTRARRIVRRHGRDVVVNSDPLVPGTAPAPPTTDFYYDYFLGLWVATTETASQSTYLLYADQGETQPAGSIVTIWPADNTVFPQTYSSTYSFTSGYLSGSSGTSNSVYNADNSSTSTYSDTYSDGSSDSGTSVETATGDSTWTSSTIAADGSSTTFSGTFRSDGSGGTHTVMSDGYVADYIFNADGSGSGKITGPDPGLPATIKWDVYGDTTITFADGSDVYYPGWSSVATGVAYSDGTTTSGSSGSGSSGSGNSGTIVPNPPASTSPLAIGI